MAAKIKSHRNPEGTRIVEEGEHYNLTHLSPFKEFARGRLIHRDFNAHVFRWCHAAMVLHKFKNRETAAVMDVGCGPDWPLLTTLHSNGCAPGYFLGVDARDVSKTAPKMTSTNVQAVVADITKGLPSGFNADPTQNPLPWDMIVSFEVLEHMSKESGLKMLDQIKAACSDNTLVLFSTPVFDERVGMAENHIYEWGYKELKDELESRFTLENHYGTFASLRDYVPLMTAEELKVLAKLKEYHNSAIVSCLMAPLYPEKSRNVLWHLRKKK